MDLITEINKTNKDIILKNGTMSFLLNSYILSIIMADRPRYLSVDKLIDNI